MSWSVFRLRCSMVMVLGSYIIKLMSNPLLSIMFSYLMANDSIKVYKQYWSTLLLTVIFRLFSFIKGCFVSDLYIWLKTFSSSSLFTVRKLIEISELAMKPGFLYPILYIKAKTLRVLVSILSIDTLIPDTRKKKKKN